MFERDKHSSLFVQSINYGFKKIENDTSGQFHKTFSA
jgi:hypothetical protein